MAPQDASTIDKIMVMPVMLQAIGAALTRLITTPFNSTGATSLFKDVLYAMLRKQLGIMTIKQEHYMSPTTEATYLEVAKKQGFQPDSIVLPSGCKAHWLGKKNAEKVILYFHGGGYVLPCSGGHMKWLFDLTQDLSKSSSVSAVLLGYTVAPDAQYPTQLKQAAELLEYMIEKEGKKPSDLIVAGDSAGGNLTLSLLSHLLHPHPDVSKLSISEPLRAAILISPWVKFATDDDSATRNKYSDMIGPDAAHRWASAFLGSAPLDNYNQPVLADPNWFNGLDQRVKEILVWGGGGEVLIDSIEVIGKKLKEAHSKTEVVVQPKVGHEDFIIEVILGYTKKAEGTEVIESWIKERL